MAMYARLLARHGACLVHDAEGKAPEWPTRYAASVLSNLVKSDARVAQLVDETGTTPRALQRWRHDVCAGGKMPDLAAQLIQLEPALGDPSAAAAFERSLVPAYLEAVCKLLGDACVAETLERSGACLRQQQDVTRKWSIAHAQDFQATLEAADARVATLAAQHMVAPQLFLEWRSDVLQGEHAALAARLTSHAPGLGDVASIAEGAPSAFFRGACSALGANAVAAALLRHGAYLVKNSAGVAPEWTEAASTAFLRDLLGADVRVVRLASECRITPGQLRLWRVHALAGTFEPFVRQMIQLQPELAAAEKVTKPSMVAFMKELCALLGDQAVADALAASDMCLQRSEDGDSRDWSTQRAEQLLKALLASDARVAQMVTRHHVTPQALRNWRKNALLGRYKALVPRLVALAPSLRGL